MADLGILAIVFLEAPDEERETEIGDTPLTSFDILALLAFREETGSTPSLDEKIPSVGSNGMSNGGVSEKDPW